MSADDYFDPELYEEIRLAGTPLEPMGDDFADEIAQARAEIGDEIRAQLGRELLHGDEPFPGITPGPMPFPEGNDYDAYEPDDPKGWTQ